MMNKIKTIYADPPWFSTGGNVGTWTGKECPYPIMKTEDIKTLYADPPWSLGGGTKHWRKKRPEGHYDVMETEAIKSLRIDYPIAEQAHLWMWAVSNLLPDALEVMSAWGFKYITNMVWVKEGAVGLGRYLRGKHELLLFGRKGKPQPFKLQDNGKKLCVPSVVIAKRNGHSSKPIEFYEIIEKISYPPYLELFARHPEKRKDWSYWGNEV
jgi:N6-adenosine-specific RNA methylase IME4